VRLSCIRVPSVGRRPRPGRLPSRRPAPEKPVASPVDTGQQAAAARRSRYTSVALLVLAAVALLALGAVAPAAFIAHLTVFVLAIFVGYQVVWNVTPALHTPLMSVTNAISGIIVIGALLQLGTSNVLVTVLGAVALLVATINIAGGFLVTHRMLKMFQRN
jgi:NAD(P) transhydrogenase subunit alpha